MVTTKYISFCLIIYFILLCDAISQKNRRNNREVFESVSLEHETCNAPKLKSDLKASMKRFMCQPMDTVVHLYPKEQNMMMIPDKVVVKRCYETGCYGRNSCVANNTREIPVAVRYINTIPQNNSKNSRSCGWVNVIEHVQCTCGCNIDKDQCEKKGKIFNAHECTCMCPNEMIRKTECSKQSNMVWDEDTCSCGCTKEMVECTTGFEWVPRFCECMKVTM